ncbi:translation initiation factor 1A / IF-1 domain-containing protein [Ditylenchus destructor]|nr:translation initiation factor 1A / IF-1 domain-containing protein [Ditylenchus destructor]
MPKNKGKGGKNRRRGKNENDVMKRELIEKDGDNQAYAQVQKMLGNGRLTAFCFDGKTRLCHIRGKLRKKVWINAQDIILVGLRDYQDDKADVILKYTPDEARLLKNQGQLPENAKINEGDEPNEGEVEFVDSGEKDFEGEEVGAQDRNYIVYSSSEEDEEDSDEEESDNEKPPPPPKNKPTKNVVVKKPESSESEESDEDEDSEEEDPELVAERSQYKKPDARSNHFGGRNKGRRGK